MAADPRAVASILSSIAITLALAVLVGGWGLGFDGLRRIVDGWPAMVPSTAGKIIVLGGAQLVFLSERSPFWLRRAAFVALLAAIGLALVQAIDVTWLGPAIDPSEDRRSLASVMATFVVGGGTLAMRGRGDKAALWQAVLALIGAGCSALAVFGFLFDAAALYGFPFLSGLALHSALAFLALSLALFFARDPFGFVALLLSGGGVGRVARGLIPAAVIAPAVLVWLTGRMVDLQVVPTGVARAVFTLLVVIFACLSVFISVRSAKRERDVQISVANQLQSILDGLDVAAFIIDERKIVRSGNRKANELSDGAPDRWLRDTAFFDVVSRRLLVGPDHPIRAIRREGRPTLHVGWMDPSGFEQALRLSSYPMQNPRGTLITVTDETPMMQLRTRLAQIDRIESVRQIAGGVAHEMGNFLGAIRLSTDVAARAEVSDAVRDELDAIARACARGTELTTKMLDLTREVHGEPVLINAAQTLQDVAGLARTALPPGINVIVDAQPPEVALWVDAGGLEAAVLNLVLNAGQAFASADIADGTITLSLRADAGEVVISVEDDGPGMDAMVMNKARMPFFTTRGASGGTGLGLAMVDTFATRSGAQFKLSSEPGQGAQAKLVFPTAQPAAIEQVDLSNCRVILAETDPVEQMQLAEKLTLCDADLVVVDDVAALQTALRAQTADLILICDDLAEAAATAGLELAHSGQTAPIIQMVDQVVRRSGHRADMPGLAVNKPVTMDALLRALSILMPRDGC